MKKLWNWLFQKAPEVKHLNTSDFLLAKVVTRIKAEKKGVEEKIVPLYSIGLIHPINRDSAIAKIEERVRRFSEVESDVRESGLITNNQLIDKMESVTGINVINIGNGKYVAWEGNGRLVALQKIFSESDGINIEVKDYILKDSSSIISEVNKLREINGAK